MNSSKKKVRQYMTDYLKIGFIEAPHDCRLPMCLLCHQTLSNEAMKYGRLLQHFNAKHSDKSSKPLSYFQDLRQQFYKRPTLMQCFAKLTEKQDKSLIASYEISHLIAKSGKPHTIGEQLIKPAISVFLQTAMNHTDDTFVKMMPLSNDVVRRRIDEMSVDVEQQLLDLLREKQFALQLDESTFCDSRSFLLAYVRFHDNCDFREEMLFCKAFETTTTASEIYNLVTTYFADNNIPLASIVSCAADGAPAMMGKNNGFLKRLKNNQPSMLTVHCVIHRENLASRNLSPELREILHAVISCVNAIKANPKAERLFQKYCKDLEKQHVNLILHTEVRWLSKGNCLMRFFELFDEVLNFLPDSPPRSLLQSASGKPFVAYLADIFQKLNVLNKELQGDEITMLIAKIKILAFIDKLSLYASQITVSRFDHFPLLSKCVPIPTKVTSVVCAHLRALENEFNNRFSDLRQLHFPEWFTQPFLTNLCDVETCLQDEMAELKNDNVAQNLFKHKATRMWLDNHVKSQYPLTHSTALKFLLPFPTTYLVESGFSVVNDLLTKKRNRLEIENRGDLRLRLTKLQPDISKLASGHQSQPSH